MPHFIAIPVGQGDAFYFDRGDLSVLVDGGKSRHGFSNMFQGNTGANGVNVAICTHNDEDHANGILGFIEAGLRCEQVWLPGRWLGILPHVLRPFGDVFTELLENVEQAEMPPYKEQRWPSCRIIEAYADILKEALVGGEGPLLGKDGWPESYMQMLVQAEPWHIGARPYDTHLCQKTGPRLQLFWSAIEAAYRIRAIAIAVFQRGIPVRWFEFDPARSSGGIAALRPVNAREITRARALAGTLLNWLALTVWNKESLAFWSPPGNTHPGVLFTADSDLSGTGAFLLRQQLRNAIATAPHHGSEANANAYNQIHRAVQPHISSITWVRSDGKYSSRPGRSYLNLPSLRLCTHCRLGRGIFSQKQPVQIVSQRGLWIRNTTIATCSCL